MNKFVKDKLYQQIKYYKRYIKNYKVIDAI